MRLGVFWSLQTILHLTKYFTEHAIHANFQNIMAKQLQEKP